MTNLITRLTEATEPTRELLLEAFNLLHPPRQRSEAEWKALGDATKAFTTMLDAKAWTSAVEMLLPADYPLWAVTGRNSATCGNKDGVPGPLEWTFAATPALALAIACLKARGLS